MCANDALAWFSNLRANAYGRRVQSYAHTHGCRSASMGHSACFTVTGTYLISVQTVSRVGRPTH